MDLVGRRVRLFLSSICVRSFVSCIELVCAICHRVILFSFPLLFSRTCSATSHPGGHSCSSREGHVSWASFVPANGVTLHNHHFHLSLSTRISDLVLVLAPVFYKTLHRSHVRSSNFSRSVKTPAVHEPSCWSENCFLLGTDDEVVSCPCWS